MMQKRVHSKMRPTWADAIALVAAGGAAMLPEFIGVHVESWSHLLTPEHLIPAMLPALAVLGAWANKFRQ